jgi:glutamate synthase (NADPH/NADH) large chain
VLDLDQSLLNSEMVDAVAVPRGQRTYLQGLLSRFRDETHSEVAGRLLADWDRTLLRLTMVMPRDYARVLAAMEKAIREGLPADKYVMDVAHG